MNVTFEIENGSIGVRIHGTPRAIYDKIELVEKSETRHEPSTYWKTLQAGSFHVTIFKDSDGA